MMKRDEIFVQVLPPNVKPPMTKPVDTATSNVGTAKPNR